MCTPTKLNKMYYLPNTKPKPVVLSSPAKGLPTLHCLAPLLLWQQHRPTSEMIMTIK